jgi:murein DD-endopeptidase MepM/ murein hydrolase activator NlpD
MITSPRRIRTFARATLPVILCLAVAASYVGDAGAVDLNKAQNNLEAAQSKAEDLGKEIGRNKDRLSSLEGTIAGLVGEVSLVQKEYDRIQEKLRETQSELADTQSAFDDVRAAIDARARATYMEGPGSSLEFLLSSSSIGDLSARAEFIDQLQQQDAEHSADLTNLANKLNDVRKRQTELYRHSKGALQVLRDRQVDLADRKAELASTVSTLEAQLAEAEKLEKKWKHKVQVYWKSVSGTGGPSPFDLCPVPDYSWIADDFGAVRYTTIPPHSHAGNDIGAPYGAPIVAPFAGVASNASNGLGGLAVYVKSSAGYVYNAHLSKVGQLGRVQAGDVVGYVGMSGDAQGTVPHDHFEWHPGGGEAVDPHPALMAVC